MTEKKRGSGASGWCLGRKNCPECAYPACKCPCHDDEKDADE